MSEITEKYRRTDQKLADFHYRLRSENQYETTLLLPTEEMKESLEKELAALKEEVEALETPDRPSGIWKEHFLDFISDESVGLKNMFEKPAGSIISVVHSVTQMFRLDKRPDCYKIQLLHTKIDQLPAVIEAVKQRAGLLSDSAKKGIAGACEVNARLIDDIIPKIPMFFHSASFTEKKHTELTEELRRLQNILKDCGEAAEWSISDQKETTVEDDEMICKFEEAYYRSILHDTLGVELDELLSWYESEMEHTRAEVFRIARTLDIPENNPKTMKEVTEILFQYAGPYETTEEMFVHGREYLDRAQEAARDYVWIPEDEYCNLAGAPEALKFSYPWGGYEGVDLRSRPILGQFFLNDYNYKAVTDGWIKMMAVHEAYPGHHVQYVREVTDRIPETAKIGAKYIPLLEGTAHRSEHVFEFIYPEDPFYPLFVAYRRHHTAVRIKADLMLRYFGRPIKEIVQLYMDELGFDKNTARGQIKAQENMEGYFTCYYYGLKKLTDWEKKYGYDEKTYSELLFSVGRISVHNFEKFLQLTPEEKKSFTNDYASLSMEEPEFKNPFIFEK